MAENIWVTGVILVIYNHTWLVVSTHLKNISQNGIISPSRTENKNI